MKELDIFLLQEITWMVKRWIKRKKYQQHKYDFLIMLRQWMIAVWVLCISLVSYHLIKDGLYLGFLLLTSLVVIAFFFEYLSYMHLLEIKDHYDFLWVNRKKQDCYFIVKEILEQKFERDYKERRYIVIFNILFALIQLFLFSFLGIINVERIVDKYIDYVFDFEEPEKKDQKEKDSVTEIVAQKWQELIRNLNPKSS